MAYATSEQYQQAIKQQVRDTKITGTLTTSNNQVININNALISAGSLYITNQCVNGERFEYGAVFAAELGVSIKTQIDRHSLYGGIIKLSYNLLTSPETYEEVPLGIFYINEANRSGEAISIKAYDGMLKLDVAVAEDVFGRPFDLLSVVSIRCGIELGQTQSEIEALVNGQATFSCSQARVKTYRDLVSYIAMCTCTFAVFGRDGKLRLVKYKTTSPKELSPRQRASGKFSDFTTFYSSATAKMLVSGEYFDYAQSDGTNGLSYNFGSLPIVQGTPETNQTIIDNIFNELKTVNNIPCDISFAGDPSIDLGDLIQNKDIKGEVFTSIVTFYKWTYHGKHHIKSAGANPKLASLNKEDGSNADIIGNISGQIQSKTMAIYTATNAKDITLRYSDNIQTAAQVLRIAFVTTDANTTILIVSVEVIMDKDGFVELATYLDGGRYDDRSIIQYCQKGQSTITYATYISCVENHAYRLEVFARTFYKETQLRVNEAKLKTNENAIAATTAAYNTLLSSLKSSGSVQNLQPISYEVVNPDTSCPTGTIPMFHAKAVIFGQGMAEFTKWDGTITVVESFPPRSIGRFTQKKNIATSLVLETRELIRDVNVEEFLPSKIARFKAKMLHDNGLVKVTVPNYIFNTQRAEHYIYDSTLILIENNMYKLSTDTAAMIYSEEIALTHDSIKGIEAAYVTCTGDITIAVSFDDKATWLGWTGTEWGLMSQDFTGMSKEQMESVTTSQWNELFSGAQRCFLRVSLLDATQSIEAIILDFVN